MLTLDKQDKKTSIASRLYWSFGIIITIAFLISFFTNRTFALISDISHIVFEGNMPSISVSSDLAISSGMISSYVAQFFTVEEEKGVKELADAIDSELKRMKTIIASLDASLPIEKNNIKKLYDLLDLFNKDLYALGKIAKDKVNLNLEVVGFVPVVEKKHEEVLKLLNPIVDDIQFELMMKFSEQNSLEKPASEFLQNGLSSAIEAVRLISVLNRLVGVLNAAAYYPNKEGLVPLQDQFSSLILHVERTLPAIKNSTNYSQIKKIIDNIIGFGRGDNDIFKKRKEIIEASIFIANVTQKVRNDSQQLEKVILDLRDQTNKSTTKGVEKINSRIALAGTINYIMVSLALFISVFEGFFIVYRAIVKRLVTLNKQMKEIAAGHLDTIIDVKGNDEVAQMARALEHFRDESKRNKDFEEAQNLAELDHKQKHKAAMEKVAKKFESGVKEVINMLSDTAVSLKDGSSSLSKSSEISKNKIINATEETSNNSRNVKNVAESSAKMSMNISQVTVQVNNVNNLIQDLVKQAEEADTSTQLLQTKMKEIYSVTEVISDINEQINLLALNASIESAKAGEQGKGFAVVANEIKNLSTRTTEANQDIEDKIKHMDKVSKQVISTLSEIHKAMQNIKESSDNISHSLEEQNSATQDIAANMSILSKGTDKVVSNLQEVSANTTENQKIVLNIAEISHLLTDQSRTLNMEVDSFLKEIVSSD